MPHIYVLAFYYIYNFNNVFEMRVCFFPLKVMQGKTQHVAALVPDTQTEICL